MGEDVAERSPHSKGAEPATDPTTEPPPQHLTLPHTTLLPPSRPADRAIIESDLPQSKHGDLYTAAGNVELTFRDRVLRADAVTFNEDTGEVIATGHLRLSGGPNDEYIDASHGDFNIYNGTGRFYDVSGSIGVETTGINTRAANGLGTFGSSSVATSIPASNPVLFTGKLVVKTGDADYTLYEGSFTSCQLPHPDWQFFSSRVQLSADKAHAAGATFRLLGVPVLFLPYITYPVDAAQRQTGFLIPDVSYTSKKGLVIGESVFISLGRSADLTVGSLYYSLRGFAENGTFRFRGASNNFFTAHFSALQDRGYNTPAVDANGNQIYNKRGVPINIYTNQGGQDATAAFRYKFTRFTRAVGDIEYLSSYIYREAFTDSFNQAVSSDITSIGYLVHQQNGFSIDGRVDRYEGLKRVPVTLANGTSTAGQEIRIFHAPSLDFTGIDHHVLGTRLLFSATASAAGLKRSQPNFVSSGIIERFDMRPELSLPLAFAGWHTLSSVALDEAIYSRSRKTPYGPNAAPIELTDPVNRASVEVKVDLRPPVIERTFQVPDRWRWLLGDAVRHTIEPDIIYRNVHGVSNFTSILRFDDLDLIADTDELEYGVTQHLYFRPHPKPTKKPKPGCPASNELVILRTKDEGPASPEAAPPKPGAPGLASETWDSTASNETTTKPGAPGLASETWDSTTSNEAANEDTPAATNDANGIPDASSESPDAPTHNRAHRPNPCASTDEPPQREWFTWQLAQKYFFDPTFGSAVIKNRRNLFDSTLALSGIAFLTEPREISPLISRLRFRTSAHVDIGWDFDYDTGATKFTSSNIFLDAHQGPLFGGFSFARLNAPGRFYTEVLDTNQVSTSLVGSATSDFSQMRVLLGYGNPAKPGLSLAGNAGIDLNLGNVQYAAIQAGYNWNCCGIAVEYRKFELGSVRNENAYRFSFTLANIGTAGNLRRAERLF